MTRVKRSSYFVVVFEDRPVVDLAAFLRGRAELTHETHVMVVSAVTEEEHRLTLGELELLCRVPAGEWAERSALLAEESISEESLEALVGGGLLLSDADDPVSRERRRREERFAECGWHPCAAYYNLLIKHPAGLDRGEGLVIDMASVAAGSRQAAEDRVARYGPPPEPFHEVEGVGDPISLPLIERKGGLYRALERRKTVRAFAAGEPMRSRDLTTILYYVFGCRGHASLGRGVSVIRKTSPSGGSLHPVEVYPLVRNVEGVATGLYHYRVRDHALVPMRELDQQQAETLAISLSAGHDFAAQAHVLLLMTARYHRNFWKYRRNVRTHSVILQDAAHLSQTLYLVSSDLGLGAFYIAFSGSAVEEVLGLDGIEEGAVGLAGCGLPLHKSQDHAPDYEPYKPGES